MNKYYANKEIAFPFRMVYELGHEKESIEKNDYLQDLFNQILFETESRITGAELLLKKQLDSKMDTEIFEPEDESIFIADSDADELIFNEECQLIAQKRLEALTVFYEAINNVYELFYNNNISKLKRLANELNSGKKYSITYHNVEFL